jgi:hypothetical protein
MESAVSAIDRLIAAFYAVFDNRDGRSPNTSALFEMFTPRAVITRIGPDGVDEWDIEAFISPREKLLTGSSLSAFYEWEVEARTTALRDIASRYSRYQKDGVFNGVSCAGEGNMFFQLCRTAEAWRISSILWQDL